MEVLNRAHLYVAQDTGGIGAINFAIVLRLSLNKERQTCCEGFGQTPEGSDKRVTRTVFTLEHSVDENSISLDGDRNLVEVSRKFYFLLFPDGSDISQSGLVGPLVQL